MISHKSKLGVDRWYPSTTRRADRFCILDKQQKTSRRSRVEIWGRQSKAAKK